MHILKQDIGLTSKLLIKVRKGGKDNGIRTFKIKNN